MEEIQLHQLAKRLSLTSHDIYADTDPYILTPEDECKIIEHAIISSQKHLAWKMAEIGHTVEEIKLKLSKINWDEKINKEELLQRANSLKNYELWEKEQRKKEKEEKQRKLIELQKDWCAKRIYKLMSWTSQVEYGKKLIVNPDNKKLITALCYFISRDEKFEEFTDSSSKNFSLKKGLLIRGVSGLGKTFLVKCIEKNMLNPILILSMIEISETIKEDGDFKINMGKNNIIYLDDVGTEESVVNHYGNKINFFKNFIETTYMKHKIFNNIIISTNNNFSEMEQKYGFRVRSRIKDMFNVIDVSGTDMRG